MKQAFQFSIENHPGTVTVFIASSFWEKLCGLLGTDSLAAHTGLLLRNCRAIHMFGMRYAIDLVYVDKEYRIAGLVREIQPWHMSFCLRARHTIELPAGTIEELSLQIGMTLCIEKKSFGHL